MLLRTVKLFRGSGLRTLSQKKNLSSYRVPDVLKNLESKFESSAIPEAKISARHLVSSLFNETNMDRFMSTCNVLTLSDEQMSLLETYAECRLARMPVQYIVGNWDFLDLTLKLRPPVFIPRPETEQLVGLVIEQLKASGCPVEEKKVIEVGCGSGAISLALARSLPELRVTCLDQSKMACDLTLENAQNLNLDEFVTVVQAKVSEESIKDPNFVSNLNNVDLIVSNPPYILRKDLKTLQPEITMYEDLRALDGGSDGLAVIVPILKWASNILKSGGYIFLETDPCHPYLIPDKLKVLRNEDPNFGIELRSTVKDFTGKERFMILQKDTS